MTLLEELGLTGPIRSLSEDDRLTYSREVRRRYLLRPGKKEMVTKRMSEYRGRPEVCEQTAKTRRAYKSRPEVKRKAVEQFTDYRRRNRDLVNKRQREWHRARAASDNGYRVAHNMRSRMGFLARRSGIKSRSLGLDSGKLRVHLESLFLGGMSWENYGRGWHIDHKLPCTSFDLTDPEQVRKCFALSNLQPMWAAENIRKSNKILEEYANAAA